MIAGDHLRRFTLLTALSAVIYLFPMAWVLADDCKTPLISGPPAWPPLVIPHSNTENSTGIRTGIAIDVNLDVLKAIGATARVDASKPWNRVLRDLEVGDIDMIFALLDSEERREKFVYTDTYAQDTYGVVTLKDKGFEYSSAADLTDRNGAYYAYLKIPPPLNKILQNTSKLQSTKDVASLYRMLYHGRVDYLIVSVATFFWLIPEDYNKDDFKVIESSVIKIPVYMAISKKSPCVKFVKEINAALRSRKDSISKSLFPQN